MSALKSANIQWNVVLINERGEDALLVYYTVALTGGNNVFYRIYVFLSTYLQIFELSTGNVFSLDFLVT